MFDNKALPRLTLFQNCIRPERGKHQEELRSDIRTQRHALFFLPLVKLMLKGTLKMVTYQQQRCHLERFSRFLIYTVPVLTLSRI